MYFDIRRRRKQGKAEIVERGYATREDAKPLRDQLNEEHYKRKGQEVPEHNREFFISRSHHHRHGPSK
jgi:hypothetical protein